MTKTLGRRCTDVIQMFLVWWVGVSHIYDRFYLLLAHKQRVSGMEKAILLIV